MCTLLPKANSGLTYVAFATAAGASALLLVLGLLTSSAWAQREDVLYSFCSHYENRSCIGGAFPAASVVFDQKGNLYGTTEYGGPFNPGCDIHEYGCGVAFKLTPDGKETVLHNFCTFEPSCADGYFPSGGLIPDQDGNLYGTTLRGGTHVTPYGGGTVFKLTPEGKETVIYSFCAKANCADGEGPVGGLIFDQRGNLYGTTGGGGAHINGTVFKLTPEGKETVIYSFCAKANCGDGAEPNGGLVFDQQGNLYGTTTYGGHPGDSGFGVVFKLTPGGNYDILHTFCEQGPPCADGANPKAGLTLDEKGNLYGTTIIGGAYGYGSGTVFKVTTEGEETVLYSFCAQQNCSDGGFPSAGVVLDQGGSLYGTTSDGGNLINGCYPGTECGVVFKITPEGEETVLYAFCRWANCTDGKSPYAGVIFGQDGNLYGTASRSGFFRDCVELDSGPCGVVFKLTP